MVDEHAAVPGPPARAGAAPAFLLGGIGPAVTALAVVLVAPAAATPDAGADALRRGGLVAVCLALVLGVLVGWWMLRACRRGGSAFLAPMAGGFLLKLFVLAGGTLLLAGPLRGLGHYIAFALAFAAGAFSFQAIFTTVLNRTLRRAAARG